MNRWAGRTVICVASGPSLTQEDCALAKGSGHPIIAVNNSWQAIECDVLYASDHAWWRRYTPELRSSAERWSNNKKAVADFQCEHFRLAQGYNSGLAAIHLALWFGASRILLLGYDCQPANGSLHWHGPHIRCNNPNEISFRMWQKQFRQTGRDMRSRVVNCSRETALTVFARATLEEALQTAPFKNQALVLGA
jgi:hypothetical protein